MTDVSIIIVAYRGQSKLLKCLESIVAFKGRNFSYQVIIVDNDVCGDPAPDIEKRFRDFKFIRNKVNGGFANGNNLGAKSAQGEFLLILNPDTVLREGAIERLLKLARANPGYSLISCRQVNREGKETKVTGDFPTILTLTGLQRSLLKIFSRRKLSEKEEDIVSFHHWISGSLMLIRKKLFEEHQGFYEGFWMYYEDVDLCKRVADRGGRIVLARDVTIEHNHGGSSRSDLRTTAVTKTEVRISQHIYIARNMNGIIRLTSQTFLVANNLITGTLMALSGILLFFLPVAFVRTLIFFRLVSYYLYALCRRSWISRRSVLNHQQEC